MFSIITPTYNRSHTINRVYDSLLSQTYTNFEWIIIDDASTDNTEKLISNWKKVDNSFKILYVKLDINKGKPNAINVALEYCTQPITIIADSDDAFKPVTLEQLKQLWLMVDSTLNSEKIATIWTLVKDERNELVGEKFPHNLWQVNFQQRIIENWVSGEKWHSWRTDVLKKYKMYHSEFSFISESATWNTINKDYDFLCVNIFHRTYFSSPDGLIQKKKTRLEIEKLKFYNAYYQLKSTKIIDIISNKYYQRFAFDYIKSSLFYKEKDLCLSKNKSLICTFFFILRMPQQFLWYYKFKKSHQL